MSAISPSDFPAYFHALHGHPPFHWQSQLAAQVCAADGQWPDVIDLPTASGKTACLDIALFSLACRPKAPRRFFFVVDRKVIVDEAFARMGRVACTLAGATDGILLRVAARLRELAGGAPDSLPLATFQLRGGIYRDERWVRSPLQPTFVASTVDQIGSRLLFRGYGVSDSALPIHAGLISTDSLIFLDEAHCSKAFAATLARIERYRSPAVHSIPTGQPLRFVEMTATPSRSVSASFTLPPADLQPDAFLGRRLRTPKPTRLVPVKAKSDDYRKIAAELVKLAHTAAADPETLRIAIIVNRVSTARHVYDELRKSANAELLTGRMRPIDRDEIVKRLAPLKSGEPRPHGDRLFVIATQCLEVGADLDFDVLLTECASIDALLQRFGRLDRLGEFGKARGWILLTNTDPKRLDAVYGASLAETRLWLESLAAGGDTLDFALQANTLTVPQHWALADPVLRETLLPKAAVTPALLPAHLDTLCQTSPRPQPEPEVSFFLHGSQPADADVQIVWRADLDAAASPANWLDVVKLIPPVVAEALPVKIWAFRKWIAGETEPLPQADVEGTEPEPDSSSRRKAKPARPFLIWRGERSVTDPSPNEVRPGDTIVIPASYGGFDALGHIPDPTQPDVAGRAFATVRRRIRLRLHPNVFPLSDDLKVAVRTESPEWEEIRTSLESQHEQLALQPWDRQALLAFLANPLKRFHLYSYPGQAGWIVEQKPGKAGSFEEDGEADEASAGERVILDRHTAHVSAAVAAFAAPLLDPPHRDALELAAHWHDTGKADPRFQALLLGGDPFAARFSPVLYAKGRFVPKSQSELHYQRSGLPKGFRHELASLTLAAQSIPPEANLRDLILHLIAAHHGRCRPFAPIVHDPQPETFTVHGQTLTATDRLAAPPHHLAAGVPGRFWSLIRSYGWWGLAYLEAILRLSDWSASAAEQRSAAEAREQEEEKEAAQEPVHA